jgi:hypothetical protein
MQAARTSVVTATVPLVTHLPRTRRRRLRRSTNPCAGRDDRSIRRRGVCMTCGRGGGARRWGRFCRSESMSIETSTARCGGGEIRTRSSGAIRAAIAHGALAQPRERLVAPCSVIMRSTRRHLPRISPGEVPPSRRQRARDWAPWQAARVRRSAFSREGGAWRLRSVSQTLLRLQAWAELLLALELSTNLLSRPYPPPSPT